MRYSPVARDVHTLYVPEDFANRVAEHAATGDLFPELGHIQARVERCEGDFVRVHVCDSKAVRALRFNVVDVWRADDQTIQFRAWYRPASGERLREWRRITPTPPVLLLMVPVVASLAVLAPELLLMPVIGLGVTSAATQRGLRPLGRQLKAIADGAA